MTRKFTGPQQENPKSRRIPQACTGDLWAMMITDWETANPARSMYTPCTLNTKPRFCFASPPRATVASVSSLRSLLPWTWKSFSQKGLSVRFESFRGAGRGSGSEGSEAACQPGLPASP